MRVPWPRLPGVQDLACDGASTRFRTADAGRTLAELTRWLREQGIDVTEMHVQKASLEDVFLELTGADR